MLRKPKSTLLVIAALSAATGFNSTASNQTYISETFVSAPAGSGWQTHGAASLFQWNAANQNLEVTWDSAQPTSYFYLPLGKTFTSTNSFIFGFDLNLADIAGGTAPDYPYSSQIAVALLNFSNATNSAFSHAEGYFPNVVEFQYYPYVGGPYGGGPYATAISSAGSFSKEGFTEWFDLETNVVLHLELRLIPAERRLTISISRNGQKLGPLKEAKLPADFGDLQVDTLAIANYNHKVPWEPFGGSVLAHGTVDNLFFLSPAPVEHIQGKSVGGVWETQIVGLSGWTYQLQRSAGLKVWENVGSALAGNGGNLTLQDPAPLASAGFYRVQANRL